MDTVKHWSGMALVGFLVIGAVAVSPVLADERQQLAAQPSAADLKQIERELYEQGYQRISHMRIEGDLLTARALDEEKRPVFLGVAPETGRVVATVAMD